MGVKIIKYPDVVSNGEKLLFLSPGIYSKKGGMYEYAKTWYPEIQKYTSNFIFLTKPEASFDFEDKEESQHISSDEKQKYISIIAILNMILPVFLVAVFLSKEYKSRIKKYGVVHILTASIASYTLIRCFFFLRKDLKVIYTLHDPKSHDEKISFLGKMVKEHANKKLFSIAKKNRNFFIHIHSDALIEECPSDLLQLIVHPHPLPQRIKERTRQNDGKVRIGFLGRIEPYKGLPVLYQALADFPESYYDKIEVVIVGRGNLENDWKSVSYHTEIYNDFVEDDFFHEVMANLDLLVLPYIKASQSGVGYMALAYEIPIIATETGGLPDIVRASKHQSSRIIEPNNIEALKQALSDFYFKLIKAE